VVKQFLEENQSKRGGKITTIAEQVRTTYLKGFLVLPIGCQC